VRGRFAIVTAALIAAGCSGSTPSREDSSRAAREAPNTLHALAEAPGPDVAIVAGTSDFEVGGIRYTFLLVRPNGASVERHHARVWLAHGLDMRPFERTSAVLEAVSPPSSYNGDVKHIYVAHLHVAAPGTYWLLAEPDGGQPLQALGNLVVRRVSLSPPIGSRAYPARTPTLATVHGDVAKLTTRTPPDRALLRYSLSALLAAHEPFVVAFATPKFCTSRTCGPVVDVVAAVQKRLRKTAVRFVHVEIYQDNDPIKGFDKWVEQWHLPTEPWVFLVGRGGRIKAKFEGSVSVSELTAAVRTELL
jgi:hypothetical protein